MRNIAKCKRCHSVIESFVEQDMVSCKCGAISVSGGSKLQCAALDWNDFVRVDDEGNEIVVSVKENESFASGLSTKPDTKELINMLDEMIASVERLPSGAMITPVSHYDFAAALLLLSSIFKSFRKDES